MLWKMPKCIYNNDLFRVLSFVEHNQKLMYICEVSMLVYGDSKYFENNTLESLCALLQKYNTVPIFGQTFSDGEYIFSDEILKKYYVYKEPQKISIRGKALIRMCGKDIDISGFDEGIEFTVSELSKIECVQSLFYWFILKVFDIQMVNSLFVYETVD